MNRDDIFRMARDVGAAQPETLYGRTDYVVMTISELERFAALVAAAEREACAKVVWATPDPDDEYIPLRRAIADAIRARGNE